VPEGPILNIGHVYKIADLVNKDKPFTGLMEIEIDLTDYFKKVSKL